MSLETRNILQVSPARQRLSAEQLMRFKRFNVTQAVDVHCHCLPGMDDGPRTLADSLQLCRALVADGISVVVATPHQLGRYNDENSASVIRQRVKELNTTLEAEEIPLRVEPGADVRVDERLILLLDRDEVMTVADQDVYLLLELPHDVLIELTPMIRALRQRGITPVITHPERQVQLWRQLDRVVPWVDAGAVHQVTAGSVTGEFGPQAQEAAWAYLAAGYVAVIASDAHDCVRRPPRMTAATELISAHFGHLAARRVCVENPVNILNGHAVVPMFGQVNRREMDQ